jgi:hypothetical protein
MHPTFPPNYLALHMLGEIPEDIVGFKAFHVARLERMRAALMSVLSEAKLPVETA